ncbi:sensor histidine kinase [Methylibium rhizosphaerae]|uniref:sensor histidine kinase n=1 Tax=Methylibium rhizosphaerae TaxID=2570323 RepID=UPI001C6129FD|nr:ATP-binding protein [Methylibium rhizosphaerae]
MAKAGAPVGDLIRTKDWSATPLGPRDGWPVTLHHCLGMLVDLPAAAAILWGQQHLQLYNEGYSVLLGPRHPQHLGSPLQDVWPQAHAVIHPSVLRVLETGEAVRLDRRQVPVDRSGFTEDAWFNISLSALRDDHGRVAAVLVLMTEVSEAVLGERRTGVLHALSSLAAHAAQPHEVMRRAAEVLGQHAADLPFCRLYAVDPADGRWQPAADERAPVLVGDRPVRTLTLPIVTGDGQGTVAVLVVGLSPSLAYDDAYQRFIERVAMEVSTLISAARAREELSAQVARANEELESFGHALAHDLRSPLFQISGYSDVLLQDHGDSLTGGARECLDRVQQATRRMGQSIEDLLVFSRVARAELKCRPVDLSVLAQEIIDSMRQREPQREVRFEAMPELVTSCDAGLLRVVLANLLGNAWKYTSRQAQAYIAFGAATQPDGRTYFVRDNGVGFDMEHAGRLFKPFQRLHAAAEFPGSGIGLSTAARIVRRHGGRIWALAAAGEGATFHFTIPGD